MNGCEEHARKDASKIVEDVIAQLVNMEELELAEQLAKALRFLKW